MNSVSKADINSGKVVFTQELPPDENRNVLNYLKFQTVWLLAPYSIPLELKLYQLE